MLLKTSSTRLFVVTFNSSSPFLLRAASSAAFGYTPRARNSLRYTPSRGYAKSRKMPPKKQVVEEKIPLGRPGNNLKSGIVSMKCILQFVLLVSLLIVFVIGWFGQRRQIYSLPGYHQV